jgi:hypothetical protein
MFVKKFLPFAVEQSIARAGFNEHAEASSLFDELFIDQFLISLQNSERVDPIFGRDIAHRRQRIAFVEHAVENHVNDTVAQLAINRLTIIPFTIHSVFGTACVRQTAACAARLTTACSCSVIDNYITMSHASFFFAKKTLLVR